MRRAGSWAKGTAARPNCPDNRSPAGAFRPAASRRPPTSSMSAKRNSRVTAPLSGSRASKVKRVMVMSLLSRGHCKRGAVTGGQGRGGSGGRDVAEEKSGSCSRAGWRRGFSGGGCDGCGACGRRVSGTHAHGRRTLCSARSSSSWPSAAGVVMKKPILRGSKRAE